MIYIEIPLWLAIIIVICFIVLLIYFIIGDLFARLMHKHYQLILREREKENKKDTIEKFNEVEKIILENLDPSYKYIARDRDGKLWVYDDCPKKSEEIGIWVPDYSLTHYGRFSLYKHLFQGIKWEDEEPYKFR